MRKFKEWLVESGLAPDPSVLQPGAEVEVWDKNWQGWVPGKVHAFRGSHYEVVDLANGSMHMKVSPKAIRLKRG